MSNRETAIRVSPRPSRWRPSEVRVLDIPASHARTRARADGEVATGKFYAIPLPSNLPVDPPALRLAYRAFEVVVAAVMLVISAPIILLEALVIRLDSPGPAFFWQERFARSAVKRGRDIVNDTRVTTPDGTIDPDALYLVPQTFRFLKFRTMFVDARERFPELYAFRFPTRDAAMQGYYKYEEDPRVTRAGRFLRRTTLDELPNLWLVLTGQMRLVGPRPEGEWVLKYYYPEHMELLSVEPGVTGLAQARGRSNLTIGERLGYDLEYVRTRSVWLDIQILAQTFISVVTRRGAY